MDVKALYRSMSWIENVKSVKWLILKSDMKIVNVNWHDVGKYLAVVMTARKPGVRQQNKMLALAISYGVYTPLTSRYNVMCHKVTPYTLCY